MKVLKYSTIALLIVLSLSISSVSASRSLVMNQVNIPGNGEGIGHIEGPLEKDTISSQYLRSNNSGTVIARVYGKGMDGSFGWQPNWQVASGNYSWTQLGYYNNGAMNPNQYGIFASNNNALGIKNSSSSSRSFSGIWITDKDLYDAFIGA